MTNDDAISRADAIRIFAKWLSCENYNEGERNIMKAGMIELQGLPSVEPKQRTGHWILLDNCSNAGYYCSECHKKVVKEGWSETVKTIKFCPNCGIPLEGVEYR